MSLDAIQERFIDEIKLRGYDDKYIDKNEEREILQIAIQQGMGLDTARAALVQVCASLDYVLETDLMKVIKEQFDQVAEKGIDLTIFKETLNKIRAAAHGQREERELSRLLVHVIEDSGLKVRSSWPFNWYRAVKRDIGKA